MMKSAAIPHKYLIHTEKFRENVPKMKHLHINIKQCSNVQTRSDGHLLLGNGLRTVHSKCPICNMSTENRPKTSDKCVKNTKFSAIYSDLKI